MSNEFILNNVDFSKIRTYNKTEYLIQQISPQSLFFTSQSMEGFDWNHNNSDFKQTEHRVKSIAKVEDLISKGMSINDIKQQYPDTQSWIDDAFCNNPIRVYKDSSGRYLHSGDDGRHRSVMARILDIPLLTVVVVGETTQKLTSLVEDEVSTEKGNGLDSFQSDNNFTKLGPKTSTVLTNKGNGLDSFQSDNNFTKLGPKTSTVLTNRCMDGCTSQLSSSQRESTSSYIGTSRITPLLGSAKIDDLNMVLSRVSNDSVKARSAIDEIILNVSSLETELYCFFYDQEIGRSAVSSLADVNNYLSKVEYRLQDFETILEQYRSDVNL